MIIVTLFRIIMLLGPSSLCLLLLATTSATTTLLLPSVVDGSQLAPSSAATSSSSSQAAAASNGQDQQVASALVRPPEPMALLASGDATSGQSSGNNINLNNKQQQQSSQMQMETPNVIIIKYANVTNQQHKTRQQMTTTGEINYEDNNNDEDDQLKTFKLYNEPLSVQVIESKFAHSIQLFDVSQNQLSTLSKDLFCPLSNEVRQLNISHNLLENFDCLGLISQAGQLCLSELRVLDMSHNLVRHLPATGVATLHNLEHLDLSNNLIESLDELSLSALFKLTKLDLSFNKIHQLPLRIFHKSSTMRHLRLQANQLSMSITHTFLAGLTALEELDLSYNNISQLADSPFTDKLNLTRVDLRHNQLAGLRPEVLKVSSVKQVSATQQPPPQASHRTMVSRHRLHHNGELAAPSTPRRPQQAATSATPSSSSSLSFAEFYLAANPFICDCQLEWLRNFQQPASAIKRTVLSSTSASSSPDLSTQTPSQFADAAQSNGVLQNDQASPVITHQLGSSSPAENQQSQSSQGSNISEITSSQQLARPSLLHHQHQQQLPLVQVSARIGDLDLIKCSPLFRRNQQQQQQQHLRHHHYHGGSSSSNNHRFHSAPRAPSDGAHHNYAHHANHHHYQQALIRQQQAQVESSMIDLVGADPSNFLCRYKSHCFALCQCCEFDACDCEMICPNGCNCYYNLNWQTNIIDCSANNHTVVPAAIPMDVSGLYLDGNNIDSLRPSNLIARKSLKTLYLNSSSLQHIANRTFNGLIELQTLYLHDNMLATLHGYEFEPLAQLRALYLQSNKLEHINNQTFIYLRSLEILDLSNNRLTSQNLDLFWSIGHHNIRLRQLSIAHNWWSCQCSSINRFRSILKQKFLLTGSVTIADKNQLRCYYNATTVGPLVLAGDGGNSPSGSASSMQQLLYLAAASSRAPLLTEINQCSETDPSPDQQAIDLNPPILDEQPQPPPPGNPFDLWPQSGGGGQPATMPNDVPMMPPNIFAQQQQQPPLSSQPNGMGGYLQQQQQQQQPAGERFVPVASPTANLSQTSFVLLAVLLAGLGLIGASGFVFVWRQQQRYHQSHHHKKSSAANSSTTSSSSASSTAISSLAAKSRQQAATHLHAHPHHHHHLIMSSGSGGAAAATTMHRNAGDSSPSNNIYAALVGPHHSSSLSGSTGSGSIQQHQRPSNHYSRNNNNTANQQHWTQQSLYSQPAYGLEAGNHYASSQASYKTVGASLYQQQQQQQQPQMPAADCGELDGAADWIRLPKVKQFVSKLVNKSLALGGYRSSASRDELSSITSDKIYDAFISYDKRDETFVMQHLSAELEYGQPQYRVADRYRDLPQPSSAYIAEAITSVIGCSHRTIVVLTEHYLASDWCRYELQAALQEAALDKTHKIIAVVLDPKCLLDMDGEMRALLTNSQQQVAMYQPNQQQQLVQVDPLLPVACNEPAQLVASLSQQSGQQQVVATSTYSSQLATSKISFINYNERKFWPKLKQLMPMPRQSSQTLTLTTKN